MDKLLEIYRMDASEGLLVFWTKEILVAAIIFGLFWGLSQVVRYLLEKVAPRFTSFTQTDLDDRILQRITPPTGILVLAAGLYVAINSVPLPDKVKGIVAGIIFVVNIIILTNIAYRACDEFLRWYSGRQSEKSDPALNRQLMPLVEKLVTIFLGTTALIITLKHFNYDILSLVTALGIGSLAIGMAAKDTLANMISGFTIMIDRPFRIGDRIQVASAGQLGDVVDIGLRSTKIKTPDNTFLIIPNSDLCNRTVINMAFPDVKASGSIKLVVSYGTDVTMMKELLVETAAMIPDVLQEPAPAAHFTGFGAYGLEMQVSFWVENYTMVFGTTDKINTLLLHRLTERGITIPYPTRTVLLEKGE